MVHHSSNQPEAARSFAVEVVRTLREAGHEAYWAGGCVRDRLLGREPKDYDVATDAQPRQVRKLFGHRRTLAVGASFGVITILGPKGAGQIEVATFREDAGYSDGRHPDAVHFTTAQEDASRRDFTINGLFYDPLEERVIDYVGGQDDLRLGQIRAIGNPVERFTEDKLRMLRALRFTVTFDFQLEPQTLDAIRQMAEQIRVVSPERISAEMRQVLTGPRRAAGIRLLIDSGLAAAILPELNEAAATDPKCFERTLEVVDRLDHPGFSLALAAAFWPTVNTETAGKIGERWRLTNKEIDRIAWLLDRHGALDAVQHKAWSSVQRVLVAEGAGDLLDWMQAERATDEADDADVAWCRRQLARPHEEIDPAPLLSGADLIEHGVPRGPIYRELLDQVRDAQLDGRIDSTAAALQLVDRILSEN
ncbi:MAG: CCA tRNA nucleotidyltransferase [Planctomycetaceae bacterium]|nr:CCA tRNA nucleotidyltransferase [Planctomycetaceae bacterium]